MLGNIILYGFIAAVFAALSLLLIKGIKNKYKLFAINAAVSIAGLFIIKLFSLFMGFTVAINLFSLAVSGVLGFFGISLMLFLNLIF